MSNHSSASKHELYALVLSGGKSTRMGLEKSEIQYFNKPQVIHLADELSKLCKKVFISVEREKDQITAYPQLVDAYHNIGPMAGLLTAFKHYPTRAWLCIACDLPYLTNATIKKLIAERDLRKKATCLMNPQHQSLEPLICIYEPSVIADLRQAKESNQFSLNKILQEQDICTVLPTNGIELSNVNTLKEMKKAKDYFQNKSK